MLVEDKKLRWWGIDMRSRTMRRIAVATTYGGFLVAEWWHPARTYQFLWVLFYGGLLLPSWPAIEEATSVWLRRGLVGVALLFAAEVVWHARFKHDPINVGLYAFTVLCLSTVFAPGKLVEMSGRSLLGQAVNKGEPLSGWKQRRLARMGFAIGLEGFAWYEYMLPFRRLTMEQKVEIREMRAANPRGKWMREQTSVVFDDERMRHEDERLRARVQRVLSAVLFVSAMVWYLWSLFGRIGSEQVVEWGWTVAGFSLTLRQATVLWVEDDPRAVAEELVVVGQRATLT